MQCLLLYYSPLIEWLLPKTVLLNGRLSESLSQGAATPPDYIVPSSSLICTTSLITLHLSSSLILSHLTSLLSHQSSQPSLHLIFAHLPLCSRLRIDIRTHGMKVMNY